MNRAELAKQNFLNGYNCAQAVAVAFADLVDIPADQIAKMVSGYGGGMGRMREVCGSVSGAIFIINCLYGYNDPNESDGKKELYSDIQTFCKEFQKENGSIICRELLGLDQNGASSPVPEARTNKYYEKRPCAELVECSAKILDEFIKSK